MNKRNGASAVGPRFYFTTLLVLVIIIFLCTPGGRKSFRQAGLTNGDALVHWYWFALIAWPFDYDIETVSMWSLSLIKIETKRWGWNDPGDWFGWIKHLVTGIFITIISSLSNFSNLSNLSKGWSRTVWFRTVMLHAFTRWVILVPSAAKRWLIRSTRHVRSWS